MNNVPSTLLVSNLFPGKIRSIHFGAKKELVFVIYHQQIIFGAAHKTVVARCFAIFYWENDKVHRGLPNFRIIIENMRTFLYMYVVTSVQILASRTHSTRSILAKSSDSSVLFHHHIIDYPKANNLLALVGTRIVEVTFPKRNGSTIYSRDVLCNIYSEIMMGFGNFIYHAYVDL